VYVRVWERLPDLHDPKTFDGWLRRVAVTVILRRREQAARTRSREAELSAAEEAPARVAPAGLALDLERAVARLPIGARDVFVLYDVEGHDHREIGKMLGISPHTSRSQLHRARTLLAGFLKEEP
jgi:RNA polymerase sigma-70 factor (ECF subfamily)